MARVLRRTHGGYDCAGRYPGWCQIDCLLLRMSSFVVCVVTRRRFPMGASPARQTLQPEATGALWR
jgi:hypothetical protein